MSDGIKRDDAGAGGAAFGKNALARASGRMHSLALREECTRLRFGKNALACASGLYCWYCRSQYKPVAQASESVNPRPIFRQRGDDERQTWMFE